MIENMKLSFHWLTKEKNYFSTGDVLRNKFEWKKNKTGQRRLHSLE